MSLGSNSQSFISDLIQVGADAMTNLYFIEFSGSLMNHDENLKIGLRVRSKDFTPPTFTYSASKNTVHYMTTSVDLPLSVVSGDKSLTFNFRVDSNYRLYEFLLRQQAMTSNANLGFANTDVHDSSNGGFKVDVYAFDRSKSSDIEAYCDPSDTEAYTKLYSFDYCWIKSISGLNFSYDNTEPESVTVNVGFFTYDDPMNLLLEE